MERNGLRDLPISVFTGAEGLKKLTVTANNLAVIDYQLVAFLSELNVLVLQHNRITEVAPFTFSAAGNLKLLALSGNQLTSIGEESFSVRISWRPNCIYIYIYIYNRGGGCVAIPSLPLFLNFSHKLLFPFFFFWLLGN